MSLGQRWLDLPLQRKGLIVAVLPLIVFLPMTIGSLVIAQRQSERRIETRHEIAVQKNVNDLLTLLVSAETGIRGYAATIEPLYLEPFTDGSLALPQALAALDAAARTSGDMSFATALDDSARAIITNLDELRVVLTEVPPPAIVVRSRLLNGKSSMDSVRERVVTFNQNIDMRTAAGRSAVDSMQRSLLIWLVVASVLGGLATIAGLLLLTSGIVRRVAAVSRNAHDLSAHRPLAHIDSSRDEIGVMVEDLKGASALLAQSNVELGVSRDKAIRATQAKNDFLSRVSHELRTPLTAIIGFGQLLQLEELSRDDRDSVDHIVTAGHHLHDLINDLIDISQIESGNLSLSVEPVGLRELFDETIAMFRPMAATFGVREPVVTLSLDSPPMVWADRRRLKQVLLNLISNAIKYNVVGGGVEVRGVFIGEASVRIEVVDTGRGISSGAIDRLFQPFERLDAEHSGIEGTGVGLALSKSLVEAMRGTIGVESVKDHGSTFWVQLPRAESERLSSGSSSGAPPAGAPLARSSSVLSNSGRTTSVLPTDDTPIVLYVEDNEASIALVRLVFVSRTEHLEVVGQGGLVRDIAIGVQPCLILLDQHLPDMNGEDVMLRLKADQSTCDIPVVIVSAEMSATRRERVLELGALDYLGKPLDPTRLNALVDRVVQAATLHA